MLNFNMSMCFVIPPVPVMLAVFTVLGNTVLCIPPAPPADVLECHTNEDCPTDTVCKNLTCINPCAQDICGENTLCQMKDHIPMCSCQVGYTGHPFTGCTLITKDEIAIPVVTKDEKSPQPTKKKIFTLNTIVKVNWYQALAHCRSVDMELATLDNQDDYDTLLSMIKETNIKDADYWLSGTDLGEFGNFLWMSTGKPVIYTNWYNGEPNRAKLDDEVEQCIALSWGFEWKMNDKTCSSRLYHVCHYYQ